MELELKHIKNYPSDLKFQVELIQWGECKMKIIDEIASIHYEENCITFYNSSDFYFEDQIDNEIQVKPVVLPLSYLTKEHDYSEFGLGIRTLIKDHTILCKIHIDSKKEVKTLDDLFLFYGNISSLQEFEEIRNELLKLHFDIYDLIGKGLAIDKTTLK